MRIRGEVRDPITGILGSDDVLTTTSAIRQATAAALTSGERPFLVGGCCTVLPGALAAARDVLGRTAVAYLDGHLDLSDGNTSPTGEAADMPLRSRWRGPAAWVDVCGGATSRVEDAVPIGYRDPDEVPTFEQIAPELGPGFRPVSKDEVQAEGPAAVGERVAADLADRAGRFWMHLDVDILGQDEFPATDYLMPNGLDMDERVAMMRPLAASPALIGTVDRLLQPGEGSGRFMGGLVDAFRATL